MIDCPTHNGCDVNYLQYKKQEKGKKNMNWCI